MPIIESRVVTGVLTVDSVEFATQITNVALTPSVAEEGDPIEVLSGDKIAADEIVTWTLDFTAIQDFNDDAGVVNYALTNSGETVAFTFTPDHAPDVTDGVTYSGTTKVRPIAIGGGVNVRLTSEASWAVVTGPTADYSA
jgi:hypothetical protein